MTIFSAAGRQREIFIDGSIGIKPTIPADFQSLESKARQCLSPQAYGYIATGAGSEEGSKNNSRAFQQYSIVPRMAAGVEKVDFTVTLFGKQYSSPILFAPIGVLGLAHKGADLELAKAAQMLNTTMIFSNQASVAMENCAEALPSTPHWFQLYFSKSNELVESFVTRAKNCGSKAIVLTLDTTHLGWRPRDINNGYLPFIQGKGIAQYTSDPVFKKLMYSPSAFTKVKTKNILSSLFLLHTLAKEFPGNYFQNIFSKDPILAVRKFIEIYSRPSLHWDDIKWLRSITDLPILLKGILHPEDAKKALGEGINGIIVSNHGGRQIDYVRSSLDSLIAIKKVVPEHFPLLFDSGIRSGSDIFISLALGAKAVLLGRPYVYALALRGHKGVMDLVKNYMAELEITMSLSGCGSCQDIDPSLLGRIP